MGLLDKLKGKKTKEQERVELVDFMVRNFGIDPTVAIKIANRELGIEN